MKPARIPVPRTREKANLLISSLGSQLRRLDRIEDALEANVKTLRESAQAEAEKVNAQIDCHFEALRAWAEASRPAGSKTLQLPAGEISWRLTPPAVQVRDQEKVIEALRAARLGRFVRVKTAESVDKEAVAKEPEAVAGIKGISITQAEEFVVKPAFSRLERSAVIRKAAHEALKAS